MLRQMTVLVAIGSLRVFEYGVRSVLPHFGHLEAIAMSTTGLSRVFAPFGRPRFVAFFLAVFFLAAGFFLTAFFFDRLDVTFFLAVFLRFGFVAVVIVVLPFVFCAFSICVDEAIWRAQALTLLPPRHCSNQVNGCQVCSVDPSTRKQFVREQWF